jgi:hypothetical protein
MAATMTRISSFLLVLLVSISVHAQQPPPPEHRRPPQDSGPPEPWFHSPGFEPNGAPWGGLPRALARPVRNPAQEAAIKRLDSQAIILLAPAEAAAFTEGLLTPAAALAVYRDAIEQDLKSTEAQIAELTANQQKSIADQLRPQLEQERAARDEARTFKPAAFKPYLIRCLDFGYQADQVDFMVRGHSVKTSHAIMTSGYPTPCRQPMVIMLPFLPSELFVTVAAAA